MTLRVREIAEQAGYKVRALDGRWYWSHPVASAAAVHGFGTALEAWDAAGCHALENQRVRVEGYVFTVDGHESGVHSPGTGFDSLALRLADMKAGLPGRDVRVYRRGIADITHLIDGRPLE